MGITNQQRGKAIYGIIFFGSEQQSWDYAKGQAELAGGHLATITSGDETALTRSPTVVGKKRTFHWRISK